LGNSGLTAVNEIVFEGLCHGDHLHTGSLSSVPHVRFVEDPFSEHFDCHCFWGTH